MSYLRRDTKYKGKWLNETWTNINIPVWLNVFHSLAMKIVSTSTSKIQALVNHCFIYSRYLQSKKKDGRRFRFRNTTHKINMTKIEDSGHCSSARPQHTKRSYHSEHTPMQKQCDAFLSYTCLCISAFVLHFGVAVNVDVI